MTVPIADNTTAPTPTTVCLRCREPLLLSVGAAVGLADAVLVNGIRTGSCRLTPTPDEVNYISKTIVEVKQNVVRETDLF